MTDSNWAPFHDARHYQADALSGNVRSLPRTVNGRAHKGTDPLKPHPDADGYLRINYTDDNGVRHHGASRARCMLMAHDPGGYFEGAEACHGPGGRQDDRLANLRWDTSEANRIEALAVRLENSPPKPKPPKVCPRCGAQHRGRGQNCPAGCDGCGTPGRRDDARPGRGGTGVSARGVLQPAAAPRASGRDAQRHPSRLRSVTTAATTQRAIPSASVPPE